MDKELKKRLIAYLHTMQTYLKGAAATEKDVIQKKEDAMLYQEAVTLASILERE